MSVSSQRFCLYGGLVFVLIFFAGWGLVAGFMTPLPTPRDSAQEVADFYRDDTDLIRLGLVLVIAVAPLQAFFAALVAAHLRRIEGPGALMANAQLLMGGLSVLLVIFPMFLWEAVAFRPTRDPDELRLINDIAWLAFIGAFSPAMAQCFAVGYAVIQDTSERPVFPRWVAYYNFWTAFLFFGGAIVFFAKSGPFAWNGLMAFWIPAAVFGAWFIVMFFVMRRAMQEQAAVG
jgi:hypothetical protein